MQPAYALMQADGSGGGGAKLEDRKKRGLLTVYFLSLSTMSNISSHLTFIPQRLLKIFPHPFIVALVLRSTVLVRYRYKGKKKRRRRPTYMSSLHIRTNAAGGTVLGVGWEDTTFCNSPAKIFNDDISDSLLLFVSQTFCTMPIHAIHAWN